MNSTHNQPIRPLAIGLTTHLHQAGVFVGRAIIRLKKYCGTSKSTDAQRQNISSLTDLSTKNSPETTQHPIDPERTIAAVSNLLLKQDSLRVEWINTKRPAWVTQLKAPEWAHIEKAEILVAKVYLPDGTLLLLKEIASKFNAEMCDHCDYSNLMTLVLENPSSNPSSIGRIECCLDKENKFEFVIRVNEKHKGKKLGKLLFESSMKLDPDMFKYLIEARGGWNQTSDNFIAFKQAFKERTKKDLPMSQTKEEFDQLDPTVKEDFLYAASQTFTGHMYKIFLNFIPNHLEITNNKSNHGTIVFFKKSEPV